MQNQQKNENCHSGKKPKGLTRGLLLGVIPHLGCITFIAFALLGTSFASGFFYSFMANKWLSFPALFAVSALLATGSACVYLKQRRSLSLNGIAENKNYIATLFFTVISVNLFLMYFAFPAAADITAKKQTALLANTAAKDSCAGDAGDICETPLAENSARKNITIKTELPCSGHAPFITETLKRINGIGAITYKQPDMFEIIYDGEKISPEVILSNETLKEFNPKIINNE
jgi:hypothetical protein